METAPYDPDMPIRGRYVNIALLVDADRAAPGDGDRAPNMFLARLEARGDALVAVQDDDNGRHWVRSGRCGERNCWQLADAARVLHSRARRRSLAPAARARRSGRKSRCRRPGAPRPVRLGVKKGDAIEPIAP